MKRREGGNIRHFFYEEPKRINPLAKVVEKRNYPISFRLLKYNRNKGVIQGLSMADNGFEKPNVYHAGIIFKCSHK